MEIVVGEVIMHSNRFDSYKCPSSNTSQLEDEYELLSLSFNWIIRVILSIETAKMEG